MRKLTFSVIGLLVLFAPSGSRAQNFWEPVGNTTPYSATAIIIQNDGSILLADGFKSKDEGLTWEEPDSLWGFAMIWESPNGHLFGEGYYGGIDRSPDEGNSWALISTLSDYRSSFAIDSSGELIAEWDASLYMPPPFAHYSGYYLDTIGVMISKDEGLSWQHTALYEWTVPDTGGNTFDNSITFDVDNNNNIFAAISNGMLFKSSDKINWNELPTNSLAQNANFIGTSFSGSLFESCNDGLFRLDDSTWTQLKNAPTDSASVNSLTASSNGTLFISTSSNQWSSDLGLFRSTDNGNTWVSLDSVLKSQYIRCIAINSTGDRIYVGTTNYGLEESTDNGDTWKVIGHGLGALYNLHISQNGTITTGSSYSTDTGKTWFPIEDPFRLENGPYFNHYWEPIMGTWLYLSTTIGCLRSNDFGLHWKVCDSGLSADTSLQGNIWDGPFLDKCGDLLLSAPNAQIILSSDSGNSWHESVSGVPNVQSLVSDRSCNVFIGCYNGVFRSFDEGKNWEQVNTGLTDTAILALTIDSTGYIYTLSNSLRVFCSKDDGNTWKYVSRVDSCGGLPDCIMFTDARNYIYVSLGGNSQCMGIFRSTDEGMSWNSINSGLKDSVMYALTLSPDGYLFASTVTGLYRSVNSTLDAVQPVPARTSSINLDQNSPNPFTQSTNIWFTLNEPSFITLKLFNPLGSEVAVLANGFFDAGEHEITFDRGDLPDGVYFYRLEAGGESATRSFVVMR